MIKPFRFQKFLAENERYIESYRETSQEFLIQPKTSEIKLNETTKMRGPDPISIIQLTERLEIVGGTWNCENQAFAVSKEKITVLNTLLANMEVSKLSTTLLEDSGLRRRIIREIEEYPFGNKTESTLSQTETPLTEPYSENLDSQVKTSIAKLKDHFSKNLSQAELKQHLELLSKHGVGPAEITSKTGASRATIYRLFPKELKTERCVSNENLGAS